MARNPLVLVLALAMVAGEYLWRTRRAQIGYDWRAALASFGVMVGGALFKPLGAVVIGSAFAGAALVAPWQFPLDSWIAWVAGFFAMEFAYYWFHRFSHTVRWLWTTHAVHHSAAEFTLPAAVRLGWTGALSLGWMLFVPLVLIGFPPVMVAALLGANLLYQFLLHTEAVKRLGALEWVLNTPSHHRAHHSRDEAYLDCNFGGVLIVYDRLFGTFREEPAEGGLRFGLVHELDSRNPVTIALHEWGRLLRDLRAAPPRQWVPIALGPPG
ncbi:MAG: sterol desaturase family protein [Sphingomonadales bacterium]|nr:sterol desaturase family protein [Sphingomonadales bacterium]MBD3775052.1 sterol desaturase family protein [Paracoccaceae bacterium]